jgi:predicted nucleotidyltransferase
MAISETKLEDASTSVVEAIVEVADPVRIVLFGSVARGSSGPHSDLDLLVVVPPDRHRRATAQAIYRRLANIGVAVDIVVVTSEDVEKHRDNPGMVIRAALAEGRELYAA